MNLRVGSSRELADFPFSALGIYLGVAPSPAATSIAAANTRNCKAATSLLTTVAASSGC